MNPESWTFPEDKCKFPDGIRVKPNGKDDLDPCEYEVLETLKNVTIQILRCTKCGWVEISWIRQQDTISIPDEEFDYMIGGEQ